MRCIVRVVVTLLAVALGSPLVLFVGYDIAAFQSRRQEISALISIATPDEQALSPQVAQLIRVSLHGRTAAFAGRILVEELHAPLVSNGMLGWHATTALWWACSAIHLSEREQLSLIASRAHMGSGRYGYTAEALARFQRPLSALSLPEVATLVAFAQSPSAYASSPERLARRRDWLLSQAQNGS